MKLIQGNLTLAVRDLERDENSNSIEFDVDSPLLASDDAKLVHYDGSIEHVSIVKFRANWNRSVGTSWTRVNALTMGRSKT
jgi:hypothetical protein